MGLLHMASCPLKSGPASVQSGLRATFQENEGQAARHPEETLWHPFPHILRQSKSKAGPESRVGGWTPPSSTGTAVKSVAVFNLPQCAPSRYVGAKAPFCRPLSVCLSSMPGLLMHSQCQDFHIKGAWGTVLSEEGWSLDSFPNRLQNKIFFY